MSNVKQTITCIVKCESPEILRQSQELAKKRIDLDSTIPKTLISYPALGVYPGTGWEGKVVNHYKLGDYFYDIELQDAESYYKLVFDVRHNVDSHWKYLILMVMRAISDGLTGLSVSIERK